MISELILPDYIYNQSSQRYAAADESESDVATLFVETAWRIFNHPLHGINFCRRSSLLAISNNFLESRFPAFTFDWILDVSVGSFNVQISVFNQIQFLERFFVNFLMEKIGHCLIRWLNQLTHSTKHGFKSLFAVMSSLMTLMKTCRSIRSGFLQQDLNWTFGMTLQSYSSHNSDANFCKFAQFHCQTWTSSSVSPKKQQRNTQRLSASLSWQLQNVMAKILAFCCCLKLEEKNSTIS